MESLVGPLLWYIMTSPGVMTPALQSTAVLPDTCVFQNDDAHQHIANPAHRMTLW